MAPNPARVPLLLALIPLGALSGCIEHDPTLGMVPRAPIGGGSGDLVASFERAPSHTYAAPPVRSIPRAPVRGPIGTPVGSGGGNGYEPPSRMAAVPASAAPAPVVSSGGYGGYNEPAPSPEPSYDAAPEPSYEQAAVYEEPAPVQQPQQAAPVYSQQAAYEPPRAAAPAGLRQVQFLPIVGAPPDSVAQLAQALARNAPGSNVQIVAASAGTAPTRLKGYLSAMTENGQTSVIYVWDVLDAAGNRINRIQGQEPATGRASGDAWTAVGPETMEAIARRTLAEAVRSAG